MQISTSNNSLRILIIDDEPVIHDALGGYLREAGYSVESTYNEAGAQKFLESQEFDLVLLDVLLPGSNGLDILERLHISHPDLNTVIMTGHGTMEMAVQALRKGARDFLSKPIKLRELDAIIEKCRNVIAMQQERSRLKGAIDFLQRSSCKERGGWQLVGESADTVQLREQIQMAVDGGFDTILITGDTGTGKEVVAREIHAHIGRDKPFIAVSCPAIPDNLIESELFGHAKGSFTGAADNRPGSFELADGGILFLDEISELTASAQAKLLRVLETRSVRRVGGIREATVSVTVVAATNIPLDTLVVEKRFRQDLLYRLNVFSIELRPLRERPGDIIPIAEHFLNLFSSTRKLNIEGFTEDAKQALLLHQYPGNARELRNLVERAAVLTGSGLVHRDALKFMSTLPPGSSVDIRETNSLSPAESPEQRQPAPDTPERRKIVDMLEQLKWNRRETAKALGIPYSTLRYKLKKYDIH